MIKFTFRQLIEAAKQTGELRDGDADYVRDLFLDSYDFAALTKLQEENPALRKALGDLVDAVNVEFFGGMRDIGGKTGAALIQAVNVLAEKLDVAAVLEAQKHNHDKPLQLD